MMSMMRTVVSNMKMPTTARVITRAACGTADADC